MIARQLDRAVTRVGDSGAGNKSERDNVRRELLSRSWSREQIAAEMGRRWGFRPRAAWRHAWGWTQPEAADRYNQAVDSAEATMTGKRISDFETWPINGCGVKPTPTTLAVLAAIYDTVPNKLVDQHDWQKFSTKERLMLETMRLSPIASTPAGSPARRLASLAPTAAPTEEELVMAAAREARQHSVDATQGIDPGALEELQGEVARLSHAYFMVPPFTLFGELLELRNLVLDQLDRTRKPRQEADLYLILGEVSGLLASVTTALGHMEAAEEQARAAQTYGRIIDNPSLRAWAQALHVAALLWGGRPRRAVAVASKGLEVAPRGTARARLLAVQARGLALIGARDEVRVAFEQAEDELDAAGSDSLLDEIGGELGFSRARVALCASTAYVALGEPAAAERAAEQALSLFTGPSEEQQWAVGETGAYIDLAAARVLRGDLAGADEALSPVFGFERKRRTEALARRVAKIGGMLGNSRFRQSPEARNMGESIEDFITSSLGRTFRSPGL